MKTKCPAVFVAFLLLCAGRASAQLSVGGIFTGPNGADPVGAVTLDGLGNLFGTTPYAGDPQASAVVVYEAPGGGTPVAIHTFTGGADGYGPQSGVLRDAKGRLFGTASGGGAGSGVIFMMTPVRAGWNFEAIYAFVDQFGPDGGDPTGDLLAGPARSLYGTTQHGGSGGGTVFQLTPPARGGSLWTHTRLYGFTGGDDGNSPYAGVVQGADGALYGTTLYGGSGPCPGGGGAPPGCGVVFRLAKHGATWTQSVIHNFTGGSDGAIAAGQLAVGAGGVLYGTTIYGGLNGQGTVYALTPPARRAHPWGYAVIHAFGGMLPDGAVDGTAPMSGVVVAADGSLYGVTPSGGNYTSLFGGYGTIYSLSNSGGTWQESQLYNFIQDGDGGGPISRPALDSAGALWGTSGGGYSQPYEPFDGAVWRFGG
jgi:uncharacterized repeat protein (TIGR03803 family)